jgi:hypothetical protein
VSAAASATRIAPVGDHARLDSFLMRRTERSSRSAGISPRIKISTPVPSAPRFSRVAGSWLGQHRGGGQCIQPYRETACRRVSHQRLVASALLRVARFLLERSWSLGLTEISAPVLSAPASPELREASLRWGAAHPHPAGLGNSRGNLAGEARASG